MRNMRCKRFPPIIPSCAHLAVAWPQWQGKKTTTTKKTTINPCKDGYKQETEDGNFIGGRGASQKLVWVSTAF